MRVLGICAAFVLATAIAGCGASASSASPTTGPGAAASAPAGGGGGGAGNDGGNGGTNPGAGSSAPSPAPSNQPSASPTTQPAPYIGPYAVNETIGSAKITGTVCAIDRAFSLSVATPKVSFAMALTPKSAAAGTLAYAYTISSAGESDTATGTYTISDVQAASGTRKLAMDIQDRTVFKGVDKVIPFSETVTLAPGPSSGCP